MSGLSFADEGRSTGRFEAEKGLVREEIDGDWRRLSIGSRAHAHRLTRVRWHVGCRQDECRVVEVGRRSANSQRVGHRLGATAGAGDLGRYGKRTVKGANDREAISADTASGSR